MPGRGQPRALRPVRYGVARVISKLGLTSRTAAAALVRAGRVQVNGRVVLDPEFPMRQGVDRVTVDGKGAVAAARVVLMLNKPRGLVTTARDEQGRATVYQCLAGADLPWLAPVGRLDKASEGLLLFSNDPAWAARLNAPASGPDKTYHVHIDQLPSAQLLQRLVHGVVADGERLRAKAARSLRSGARHSWLEVVLDEGRNRQIRRLLEACGVATLRLVRVRIGSLSLGALAKGKWRLLSEQEIAVLST
ncbi:MAG: pseudouridine synthase [Steroidobacteraceae bacterium]